MSDNDKKIIVDSLLPTFITLEQYDKGNLELSTKNVETKNLTLMDSKLIIDMAKTALKVIGEEVRYFGEDNGDNLKKIIDTLYSTYDGIDLYPSFEDKAAHVLYLIIKDHPFIDGNKRIGTLLFDFYTRSNDKRVSITPSLPLQIAMSNPKDKELIINLIITLIQVK
jgi:prophage maintenance system killer protein